MSDADTLTYIRNPFQRRVKDALELNCFITAVFASWRIGKTDYISIEHVIRRQLYGNPDCLHLIAANTYSQLIDSTLRSLFSKLEWLEIPHVPDRLPKSNRPFSLQIWNGEKWVEFLCRSMDNFDIVAGVTLGSVWLDEVWGTERWTYDLAKSRLSDKNSKNLQMVLSSTKDEPDHWMYTDIVEPYERNTQTDDGRYFRDIVTIVEGTTHDNRVNLVDGYIEQQKATLEPRLYQRYIDNKWISTATGRAYPYFVRDTHHAILPDSREQPLILCLDFNIDPCLWLIGQDGISDGKNRITYIRHEIKRGPTDIWKMCAATKELLSRINGGEAQARRRKCVFYGDHQHGTGRGLSATASSWKIVEDEFVGWNCEFRRRSNPLIVDRVNATNSRMRGTDGRIRLKCHPDCVELTKDWEVVTYDDLRNYANQGDRTHACSAVDYMINYEYPIRERGGRVVMA